MSENCLTLGHDNLSKSCQNLSFRHFDCTLKMAKMDKMGFGNKTLLQNYRTEFLDIVQKKFLCKCKLKFVQMVVLP